MNQDGGTTSVSSHDFRTGRGPSLQVNNRPRIGESENEDRTELTEFFRIRGATRISDEINHSARRNEKLTINKLVVSFFRMSIVISAAISLHSPAPTVAAHCLCLQPICHWWKAFPGPGFDCHFGGDGLQPQCSSDCAPSPGCPSDALLQ